MKIFLYLCGTLSSLLLFTAGLNMASIASVSSSKPFGDQTIDEFFYNYIGNAAIGLSFFTGPSLFGLASLIGKNKDE